MLYREGGKAWDDYRNAIGARLLAEQKPSGEWDGEVCPVFATAIALTILQLQRGVLPIYQRYVLEQGDSRRSNS